MDNHKILDKIRKLRAHAESASQIGNQAEAEAFAAKVAALLGEYKLEMADVDQAEFDSMDPMISETLTGNQWGDQERRQRQPWAQSLATVIGKMYGVTVLGQTRTNQMQFFGRKTDVEITIYVFTQMARYAVAEAVRYARRNPGATNPKASFLAGFNIALHQRHQEEQAKPATTNGTAMVLANALEQSRAFMMADGIRVRKSASGVRVDRDGYDAGREAGQGVGMGHKGLYGGNAKPRGMLN